MGGSDEFNVNSFVACSAVPYPTHLLPLTHFYMRPLSQLLKYAFIVNSVNYNGPFTIQNFQMDDGNLLFHDIFISEEKRIMFISAPGFGSLKDSAALTANGFSAKAWYTPIDSNSNGTDSSLDLTLKLILDEQFDGEVRTKG